MTGIAKEVFTLTEAAEAYGFSRNTLLGEVAANRLVGAKKGERGHWRFRKRDLDEWVDHIFREYEHHERSQQ